MGKPTSKSSRAINYFLVATILVVWTGLCITKKQFIPFDYSHVAMMAVGLLGRGVIEFVQAVGPSIRK